MTATTRTKFEQNLGWMVLTLVLIACFMIMLPFLSAMLWAAVLTYCCWPLYQRLVKMLRGKRTLAALIMTLGMFCIILLPFLLVGATLGDGITEVTDAARRWTQSGPPAPPEWLGKLPLIGPKADQTWRSLTADSGKLAATIKPVVAALSGWVITAVMALGRGLLEMTLSILIAFFLFRDGSAAATHAANFLERIAGEQGRKLLMVAGSTIRGVVYGILGTALIQAVMAGFGFAIAGVPGAGLLAFLTFFLSVVPMGPPLIWLPAALWLFHQDATGWGIFMLIWGCLVSSVDNFVKPWLISQGSDMPFLLIFFGVMGGAFTWGFIGVFIGPTLLAVGYRLIQQWGASRRTPALTPAPTNGDTPPATPPPTAESP